MSSVYFIQSGEGGPVKIGYAIDVASRLSGNQVGNPVILKLLATCEGGKALERQFHKALGRIRLRAEWFEWHPALSTMVEEIGRGADPTTAMEAARLHLNGEAERKRAKWNDRITRYSLECYRACFAAEGVDEEEFASASPHFQKVRADAKAAGALS